MFREEQSQIWPCRTGDSLPMRSCITAETRKHCSPGQASLTDPSERSKGVERMTEWENKRALDHSQSQWSSFKQAPSNHHQMALMLHYTSHNMHTAIMHNKNNMLRNRQSLSTSIKHPLPEVNHSPG